MNFVVAAAELADAEAADADALAADADADAALAEALAAEALPEALAALELDDDVQPASTHTASATTQAAAMTNLNFFMMFLPSHSLLISHTTVLKRSEVYHSTQYRRARCGTFVV